VIADNVGDNVGDVAGMGADLFESYVGSIIAAATLAGADIALVALPFWISAVGIFASFFGYFMVRTTNDASQKDLMWALNKGIFTASILSMGINAVTIVFLFEGRMEQGWNIYCCMILGLVSGLFIGHATEFFTSYEFSPVKSITDAGITGPATVVIQGLGVGMLSTVPTVFILVGAILGCNELAGGA